MSEPALAGDIVQKPDPELLRRLEAERDAAAADRRAADEKIRRGEERIRRADQELEAIQRENDRKLCAMGVLPANQCP